MRHTHSCLPLQIKAEDCLKLEEERVTNYMHQSSRPSLLKEVETELLQQHQTTLLEKEQSGCAALLQDDKVKGLNWVSALCPQVDPAPQHQIAPENTTLQLCSSCSLVGIICCWGSSPAGDA